MPTKNIEKIDAELGRIICDCPKHQTDRFDTLFVEKYHFSSRAEAMRWLIREACGDNDGINLNLNPNTRR